jgi:predicted dienelactone hydrolase
VPLDPTKDTPVDAPLGKGGPFPLIVHSHGFMDSFTGESYLGEHLASRGYVVAAPQYPLSNGQAPGGPTILDTPNQPGDLSFVIDQLLAQAGTPGSVIAGAIDPQKIAVSGLSLGGLTTLLSTFHPRLRDPRIKASLPMAGVSCLFTHQFYTNANVPLLLLHGDADLIVPFPENSARAFQLADDPRELVVLKNGSHTGFAGLASLLTDATGNYDHLGCHVLSNAANGVDVTKLGSEAEGINPDRSVCPNPCSNLSMLVPSLDANRQQDLTKAIAAAFFDSTLRGDKGAQHFLHTTLQENKDLTVELP